MDISNGVYFSFNPFDDLFPQNPASISSDMDHQSDAYLLEQLRKGNMKAFDALFVKYYKLMVANCYFFLRDEQEAKDLVQVFFSEIWEKRLYLNMEGDIKGYLYRSIQNRCLNLQRKQTTEQKKQELFIQAEREMVPENKWTENQYKQLQDALEDMPMQRREALRMIYFEDKKYHDAANEMGISINSLKTHLKIGLRNLREKLTRD